jgi:hypothetical protein
LYWGYIVADIKVLKYIIFECTPSIIGKDYLKSIIQH